MPQPNILCIMSDEHHAGVLGCYGNDIVQTPNLASSPGQQDRMAELHALLVEELGEDPEAIEQRCRADYARGYNRGPAPWERNAQRR